MCRARLHAPVSRVHPIRRSGPPAGFRRAFEKPSRPWRRGFGAAGTGPGAAAAQSNRGAAGRPEAAISRMWAWTCIARAMHWSELWYS